MMFGNACGRFCACLEIPTPLNEGSLRVRIYGFGIRALGLQGVGVKGGLRIQTLGLGIRIKKTS